MDIEALTKQIIPAFSEKVLRALPPHEANDYRRFRLIPQQLLVNAPWNYKHEDEGMSGKLENNIKNQGQTENINVRPLSTGYYQVGNGNHRNSIFERQGRQYVLCCVHDDISEAEFKRRCIEQNETHFDTNTVKLAGLMKTIAEEIEMDDLLETMPFTQVELEQFLQMANNTLGEQGGDAPPINDNGGTGSGSLAERFLIPPFSIFDTRKGYWQDRKRQWLAIGIQSELGRGGGLTMGDSEQINHPTLNFSLGKNSASGGFAKTFNNQESLSAIMRDKKKGRGEPPGSPRPSMNYGKDKARGDGRGRPLKK